MTMLLDALRAVIISSLAGGIAGALLWVWFRCAKRTAPAVQYYLWFTALLWCAVPLRFSWQSPAFAPVAPLERVAVRIVTTVHTPLPPPAAVDIPQVAWGDVFAAVWLMVAVGLFVGYLMKHAVAMRRLHRATEEYDCALLREFTACRVRVRVGDAVISPMLAGAFRPTLYLPHRAMSNAQLRHVLAHETVHLHRGDLWLKPLALLVRCMCWFNPLVYVMHRRFLALCEISCDVAAVKKTGGDTASYLSTVLYLMCAGRGISDGLTTAMAGSARRVKERFRVVSRTRPHRAVTVLSAITAVVMLTGAVCVGGAAAGRERVSPAFPTTMQPLFSASSTEVAPPAEEDSGLLWPLCVDGNITASYGVRWGAFHRGIDIGGTEGNTVCAAAAGKVLAAEAEGYNGGYGLTVVIDHGNGLYTLYAHLDRYNVSAGEYVSAGDPIGTLGMSGNVTGPCLHFEVLEGGEAVDPLLYFVNVETEIGGGCG